MYEGRGHSFGCLPQWWALLSDLPPLHPPRARPNDPQFVEERFKYEMWCAPSKLTLAPASSFDQFNDALTFMREPPSIIAGEHYGGDDLSYLPR